MKPFEVYGVKQLVEDEKNIHGFKAPEDYFETFEERLFNKIGEDSLPKEAGFSVPDAYFSGLEDVVLKKVNASEKQTKVIPLFRKRTLFYVASIAACAAILFMVIKTETNSPDGFNDIQLATLDDYIEAGNLELDTYEVLAMLGDDEIAAINIENDFFSEENLEEYLLENIDDNTLLIE